jgi:SWI/SNF-related matrix-associated actin-dependent regulator 1 of chromatin subfamily A
VIVTGKTQLNRRQMHVDAFQKNSSVKIFIGNIRAAGVGLTLTAASHVIFAELDWVPGKVIQAEDRCHRIGQTDSVLVQHLVVNGSIDVNLIQTLIEKQRILDAALDTRPSLKAKEINL